MAKRSGIHYKIKINIEKNKQPEVIQQYSAPISNWNGLSAIMKGFSIYQSNFELRYGLINSNIPNRLLYTYVVGHGMYIRVDVLKKIGGFETKKIPHSQRISTTGKVK